MTHKFMPKSTKVAQIHSIARLQFRRNSPKFTEVRQSSTNIHFERLTNCFKCTPSAFWEFPNLVVSNLAVCSFYALLGSFALFCALLRPRTCVCSLLRAFALRTLRHKVLNVFSLSHLKVYAISLHQHQHRSNSSDCSYCSTPTLQVAKHLSETQLHPGILDIHILESLVLGMCTGYCKRAPLPLHRAEKIR